MTLLLALIALAPAKPLDLSTSKSITVDYTMTTTGTVTCSTVYKGTGEQIAADGPRVTFAGSWEVVSDSCQGNTIWVGADKKAHHTLRLDAAGKAVDEWVVHAKAGDHARFTSNIKARGQYWINELAAVPSSGVITYSTTEEQGMYPLSVTIEHALKITLGSAKQEQQPKGEEPEKDEPEDGDPEG